METVETTKTLQEIVTEGVNAFMGTITQGDNIDADLGMQLLVACCGSLIANTTHVFKLMLQEQGTPEAEVSLKAFVMGIGYTTTLTQIMGAEIQKALTTYSGINPRDIAKSVFEGEEDAATPDAG